MPVRCLCGHRALWARGRGILASPVSGPALCGWGRRVSLVLGHASPAACAGAVPPAGVVLQDATDATPPDDAVDSDGGDVAEDTR